MEFGSFVLAAATADLGDEPAAREHADAVEFRMDMADEPLAALADYDGVLPVVATNRPTWEGGEADGGDGPAAPANRDRLRTLARAAEHPAVEAVDVELASVRTEDGAHTVEAARDHGAAVVASVHDFEGTPGLERLDELLSAAVGAGDVGKLAVTATDADDALALLRATQAAVTRGETVATMAMGEPGRHTRAVAPVYGSSVGYAPVDPAEATAPGQYDLATLRGLVTALGGAGRS
jgi:3-dehydroquinate dehydratase-1